MSVHDQKLPPVIADGRETEPLVAKPGKPPSLGFMYLTIFLSSMGFTIVMPSLWFYLDEIMGPSYLPRSKQQFLGFVVGIYSVGQFCGSLVFGFWSNRRPTLEPLIVSCILLLLANLYYGFAADFPDQVMPRQYHLLISRLVVGFGAGNVALARAFVSEASTLENRNQAMTIAGGAQGVGFVLGPAIGFCFTLMPRYVFHISSTSTITIDGYTMAGYASAFFTLVNLVLIPILFRDIPHKAGRGKDRLRAPKMSKAELVNMLLVMWIFFVILTAFSVFETVTGPLTQLYFGWGASYNGLLILCAGVFSVLVFLGLGLLMKKKQIDDRILILFGLVLLAVSSVTMIPFWGTKGLALWQLILGAFWVSLGYPVASAITYALFSKVIHPIGQGDKMGYLTAGGSLARMLGPVWAVAVYDLSPTPEVVCLEFPHSNHTSNSNCTSTYPPQQITEEHGHGVAGFPGAWMNVIMTFWVVFTIVLMVLAWKRLVPYREDVEEGAQKKEDVVYSRIN